MRKSSRVAIEVAVAPCGKLLESEVGEDNDRD